MNYYFSEKILQNLNKTYFYNDYVRVGNVLELLNEKFCDFEQIVDKFKDIRGMYNRSCLSELLGSRDLFENLIQNNMLTQNDLKYLLNKITTFDELKELCWNKQLIKHILNEFVLNKEIVDKLRKIQNENIFEQIEYKHKNDEELLKLSELNKKLCELNTFDLTKDQKSELIELIKSNEVAKNKLIQLLENQLESNYDFESLMSYLKKPEKKNLMNI